MRHRKHNHGTLSCDDHLRINGTKNLKWVYLEILKKSENAYGDTKDPKYQSNPQKKRLML